MIEHELILLGLLSEKPRHGYEIKKKIREILTIFAGVDVTSVYYPLTVLEKKGLVSKRADQQGRRPKRFIYALTPAGRVRFNELLNQSFLDFKRPQFSLDLSLYFLDNLPAPVAVRRLRARMSILAKLENRLKQTIASLPSDEGSTGGRILEHNLKMVEAESRFLASLVEALR